MLSGCPQPHSVIFMPRVSSCTLFPSTPFKSKPDFPLYLLPPPPTPPATSLPTSPCLEGLAQSLRALGPDLVWRVIPFLTVMFLPEECNCKGSGAVCLSFYVRHPPKAAAEGQAHSRHSANAWKAAHLPTVSSYRESWPSLGLRLGIYAGGCTGGPGPLLLWISPPLPPPRALSSHRCWGLRLPADYGYNGQHSPADGFGGCPPRGPPGRWPDGRSALTQCPLLPDHRLAQQ